MVETYMDQLVNYLKKNLSKGYTIQSLKFALLDQGYSMASINRAIKITNEELAKTLPVLKEKPVIKVQREPVVYVYDFQNNNENKKGFFERVRGLFF